MWTNYTVWLNVEHYYVGESPQWGRMYRSIYKNKKCGSRSISKLFQTKQDSAIKIQFIKAAIADNKSKMRNKNTIWLCVEIIIIIKRKEKPKTNKN